MSARDALALVELIYAAVETPSNWPAFMDELARVMKATRAALALIPIGGGHLQVGCLHGWSEQEMRLFGERYMADDPLAAATMRKPVGFVGRIGDLCDRDVLCQSLAYREFYVPLNAETACGVLIERNTSGSSFLSIMRSREIGPFRESELTILRRLSPHLRRAVRLHGRLTSLETQLDAFRHVMDLCPHVFLQIDADCGVIYSNAAVREPGKLSKALAIENGRLRIRSRRVDVALREAVRRASSDPLLRLRRLDVQIDSGDQPCRLLLIPAGESGMAGHRQVAVLVTDPDSATRPDPGMLSELFNLTPAEARFSSRLAHGESLEEIAKGLGITRETARTHLRRVLSKTQTRRQGELVALILRSIPFASAPAPHFQ